MHRHAFQLSLAAAAFGVSTVTAMAQTPVPHHPSSEAAEQATPMRMPLQAGMPMPEAADQADDPMVGGMGRMMEMMRPMMAGRMGKPFEHVEGRIAYLKAELKVTDAQSVPWNAFADTMRADATAMKTMHDGMATAGMPMTMPDRMAAQRKMMSARMAMMDHSEPSMKALYAALSAEQRKSFDQMMSGPMGMM